MGQMGRWGFKVWGLGFRVLRFGVWGYTGSIGSIGFIGFRF